MGRFDGLILNMIKAIDISFPNAFNISTNEDRKLIAGMWAEILHKYPEEVVRQAFKNCIERATFAPKIGDIANECKKIMLINERSDEELWTIFDKALTRIDIDVYNLGMSDGKERYDNIVSVFNRLPKEIREYCSTVREFVRIQQTEDRKYLKQKFINRLPEIREHIELKENLPSELLMSLETSAERLRLSE